MATATRELVRQLPALTCHLIRGTTDCFHMSYCDGTDFVVSADGGRVWCTWPSSFAFEDACVYLLGPILGFVQQLMGRTLLHASAVVIDGVAVALLGGAGAGKSTTAAMFARLGHPVLTEDALPLVRAEGTVMAQPGYGLVRLWPDSARIVYGGEPSLPRISPAWEKLYLDRHASGARFASSAKPLGAIYVLADRSPAGDAPRIEPMPPANALLALIANTYPIFLYREARRAPDLLFFGEMLDRDNIPVRKVVPHVEPERLGQMCELICQDFLASRKSG